MGAVLYLWRTLLELEVEFVDQFGATDGELALTPHIAGCQPPQFIVDKGEKFGGSETIAAVPPVQE